MAQFSDTNPVTIDVEPQDVVTLSTGIKVKFVKPLPSNISQNIIVSSFANANIGADGRVRDGMSSDEQLKIAKRLFDYNAALIITGLSNGCLQVYGELPPEAGWLSMAKLNPVIVNNHPSLDFNDKMHKEFVFLFYFGFATEEDFELLSAKLLNR